MIFIRLPALSGNQLVLAVAAFLLAGANFSFFGNVLKVYSFASHALPLLSLALVMLAVIVLLLGVLAIGRAIKPVLIAVLMLSAMTAYFMDSVGAVINNEMLENVAQTNISEAGDLLTFRLLAYLIVLGVLPSLFVARVKLAWRGWRRELPGRSKLMALAVVLLVAPVLAFGSFYASFVRTHKPLRFYANPAFPLYSLARHGYARFAVPASKAITTVGADAHISPEDIHRELIIVVVGETARADHFGLNGYVRDTTPLLRKAGVVNFPDFHACGTSTAVSVPCMFSQAGSKGKAEGQESLLDVLQHAGVNVLWLDNNSDSKGVALRVPYQNYKSPNVNTVCDVECRDEGMLVPLQAYIDSHPEGDIFIVLHQMGNHGPAYYKRYPPAFERFTPVCRSNDLSQCSQEEIINAYDNALLYTDHFLSKTIELLKQNGKRFETALFYASDHGESLGEAGTYLHGLPKAIAPDAQLHVPAIMWMGDPESEIDQAVLARKSRQTFSHDNLFHTVLGFFEIESAIYRPELDILTGTRKPDWK